MRKKVFFIGLLILSLVILVEPSSAHDPQFVNVGDSDTGCATVGSLNIGFADCQTTLTGGYGALSQTILDFGLDGVQWNWVGDILNHSVTSESSEFAGTPGTCGNGLTFDSGTNSYPVYYIDQIPPGICYYYCKTHGPALMRGVITVCPGACAATTTTTTTTRPTTTTTTTTTLPTTTTTTTTTLPNQAPSAVSLTPVNITTAPSVAQSFTAVYSDPNGYQNIADMSLLLSGIAHNEQVHFNPTTNKFTMMGVGGDCNPGQATTLSSGFLTLNCGTSSVSGSGSMWTVTYNLTPLPPLSGTAYVLVIAVTDQGSLSNNKTTGTWTVNRPPSADSVSPMNSSTPPGTVQIFTAGYSDPDGWQNIAAANFYLSGNGGAHIEWLHYLVAPNLFTMLGTNDVCSPGQAITISNGFLSLDCGASSISGSGTVLTVTFRVTPQAPSSGIQYLIFTAASDQAGAANAIFAGNWGIQ